MDQLPTFLAYVMGAPLRYLLVLLVAYVLLLNIRRSLHTALRWYDGQDV